MILVDIHVPETNGIYDFELDETAPVGEIIEAAAELVACREGIQCGRKEHMHLYAFRKERILDRTLSLEKQGIGSGERLILF